MKRLHALLLLILGLTLVTATACSDDGSDSHCQAGNLAACDLPEIALIPASTTLSFRTAGLQPGEILEETVRIINIGKLTLDLDAIELENAEGGPDAFSLKTPNVSFPLAIEVRDSDAFPQALDLTVRYTHPDTPDLSPTGTLTIYSSDPLRPELHLALRTESGAPALGTSPTIVDFGMVAQGDEAIVPLQILNNGSEPLHVSGFKILQDARFGVEINGVRLTYQDALRGIDLDTPITVDPGTLTTIDTLFFGDTANPGDGVLVIYSNDPVAGAEGTHIPLIANQSGPCIRVNPSEIFFGGRLIGQLAQITWTIESCGTEDIELTAITLDSGGDGPFSLDFSLLDPPWDEHGPDPQHPLALPINTRVQVRVTYFPEELSPRDDSGVAIADTDIITVHSTAFTSRVKIPVSGTGSDVECPQPVIRIEEGDEVIPQTVVHLSATDSYAPFGAITETLWSVTPPEDTPPPLFLPSANSAQVLTELNSVGVYTFRLKVGDEFGVRSGSPECPDAISEVLVQPDEAIHVQLTWTTPGQSDAFLGNEEIGSDLDLHFAHEFATGPDIDGDGLPDPWFDKHWDVFWYNKNPEWGILGQSRMNPSLDRDAYDGGGPENLHLSVPENDRAYRIGVHYWNDWGFGPVDAHLKIFHYAETLYEADLHDMVELDMWCVGEIHWPSLVIDPCPGGPDLVTPNYVNTFFRPPSFN